jgi:hypothetical protein
MNGTVTKELVDLLVPGHDRTSCNDDNLNNSYGGWTGKYDENTGEKVVKIPRCARCYFLDNLGTNFEDLEFGFDVSLVRKF